MIGFIVGLVVGAILTAGGLFLLAWRDLHKLDAAAPPLEPGRHAEVPGGASGRRLPDGQEPRVRPVTPRSTNLTQDWYFTTQGRLRSVFHDIRALAKFAGAWV